jgi:DNA-binding CsgD family transcriptional regulator
MKPEPNTYKDFLNSIQYGSAAQLQEKAETIIEHFRPSGLTTSHYAPVTFLLDYSTKKYVYVNEACLNLLGYTAKYFLETGVEDYISKWYPEDFEIINTNIFPDSIAFLKNIPVEQYNDFIFSYNYRMKNASDEYITVLQRFSYIPGLVKEKPFGTIGIIFDITHFKNDTSIVHTIERSSEYKNDSVNELVFKKVYGVYEFGSSRYLSKKELDILKFISEGLSSKQIVGKTGLSINTINNHRKNMLAKLGCKSSSELISYAINRGLLL